MARAAGAMTAAARPWAARQATSSTDEAEAAAPNDATVKAAIPPTNRRRRP